MIHGILVQLPLPSNLNEDAITEAISPKKDVDGFHPVNVGLASKKGGHPSFISCTPKGIMEILKRNSIKLHNFKTSLW